MNEVNQQALDVRTIMVLICHDHDRAIAQVFDAVILFADLDAEDLDEILDLGVLHDLLAWRLANVQELTAQREDAIVVPPHHFNTREGKRFC